MGLTGWFVFWRAALVATRAVPQAHVEAAPGPSARRSTNGGSWLASARTGGGPHADPELSGASRVRFCVLAGLASPVAASDVRHVRCPSGSPAALALALGTVAVLSGGCGVTMGMKELSEL